MAEANEISRLFDSSVAYEVARECINDEIGRHQEAIYAIGNNADPRVKRRQEAVRYLIKAQNLLDPDTNPEAIEILLLVLRGIRGYEVERMDEAQSNV